MKEVRGLRKKEKKNQTDNNIVIAREKGDSLRVQGRWKRPEGSKWWQKRLDGVVSARCNVQMMCYRVG